MSNTPKEVKTDHGVAAEEVAELDFENILKAAQVEVDGENMLAEMVKEAIVSDIMKGNISVDNKGFPTVNTSTEKFTFGRVFVGSDFLNEDKFDDGNSYECQFEQIGRLTGIAASKIEGLTRQEVNRLITVYKVFRAL